METPCERRTEQPLLRIERLRDRAVSGGMILMLLGAGLVFGLFLLVSLYLLLSRLGPHGSYVQDIRPGIVIAGFGLGIAVLTSIAALIALPAARVFLPKLRLNPQAMAIH